MSARLDKAIKLLEEAHRVLEDRWFITGEDDEYNDDEVIEVDKKIIKFLEGEK